MRLLLAAALLGAGACAAPAADAPADVDFPVDEGGKEDVFGRKLVGVASPYVPDPAIDEQAVIGRMRVRRQVAWETVRKVLEPVPLLGLPGEDPDGAAQGPADVPSVPRFQTWYGADDFKRIFQALYEGLGPSGRAAREPFTGAAIDEAFALNATALDRSRRWPLDRYLEHVRRLGVCPDDVAADECARRVQGNLGGAASGTARIGYSPGAVRHVLQSYGPLLDCLGGLDSLPMDAAPRGESDFTFCLAGEMPADAVWIKAHWVRADAGVDLPVYDTDAEALERLLAPGSQAHWGEDGDRRADPGPERIYTIRLRDGSVFRLAGLHVMTKELRHWQWITLWWSDRPDEDFGADRPDHVRDGLPAVFRNYKMCVAASYEEGDPDAARAFADAPSLAAALRATDDGAGASWCSNPYLERGRHNARTNCIGCHQHGGATVAFDLDDDGALEPLDLERVLDDEARFPQTGRARVRDVFPADYLYSLNRVDDLAHVVLGEVEHFGRADASVVRPRVRAILDATGEPERGARTFAERCAVCHGEAGEGSGLAPALAARVPARDDEAVVRAILQGRGQMPAWGEVLGDPEVGDLLAFLRDRFGGAREP